MPQIELRRHVMDILAYRSLKTSDKIRRLSMLRAEEQARGDADTIAMIDEALDRLDSVVSEGPALTH
jgi:hypothetical protein